ncbi:unnamed protein product [Zymoseptoria tritici ST99CH_1A5]|uniref:Uncharacterized protein n=1 Tax=Zymoseptoria tritici ST99CH_1A5 TaxID=1276529 RepID=A0A1Y6M1B4_ZYMTR|nr:unnamed protein product [Zymoseptoria tritici ST99CH_3D1]SMY30382.1 unnamed protein product [Zymoseptoria tritici ST99CH_1A5]
MSSSRREIVAHIDAIIAGHYSAADVDFVGQAVIQNEPMWLFVQEWYASLRSTIHNTVDHHNSGITALRHVLWDNERSSDIGRHLPRQPENGPAGFLRTTMSRQFSWTIPSSSGISAAQHGLIALASSLDHVGDRRTISNPTATILRGSANVESTDAIIDYGIKRVIRSATLSVIRDQVTLLKEQHADETDVEMQSAVIVLIESLRYLSTTAAATTVRSPATPCSLGEPKDSENETARDETVLQDTKRGRDAGESDELEAAKRVKISGTVAGGTGTF